MKKKNLQIEVWMLFIKEVQGLPSTHISVISALLASYSDLGIFVPFVLELVLELVSYM